MQRPGTWAIPGDRGFSRGERRAGSAVGAGAAIALCILLVGARAASPQEKPTVSPTVAAENVDPILREPYVDTDEIRETPLAHRYVHGGFKGTEARFSIYFPPKERYQGRFFQHITPTPINEKEGTTGAGTGDQVGFAFASGGYFLVTNEGGFASMRSDPTLAAYRVNAAAARYSRILATRIYGPHRVYGYAYGGSGGAFRTIGGFENTAGVWDGVVPYVVGSPQAIPNVFTARLLALRVLKDRFAGIVDAMEPGGSGDPYSGLNREERAVLTEVTRLGFPLQSWSNYKTIGTGAFPILFGTVVQKDPGYFEDFWKVPGYAGAAPPESLVRGRVQYKGTIQRVIPRDSPGGAARVAPSPKAGDSRGGVDTAWQQLQGPPAGFELESAPLGDLDLATVIVRTGDAAGTSFPLGRVAGKTIFTGTDMAAMMSGRPAVPEALQRVKPGDEVVIDNSRSLAVQYYHRHQVPSSDFYVWDQFRSADGKPLYPQRPKLIGPEFAASAGGTTQSGRFEGKMILVESLWDQDAFPWQADWYASKVKSALGSRVQDNFRLWFVDHALHGDVELQSDPTHTVSYVGVLQQALRDLSGWVEKGVAPPASTSYRVVDGQVRVAASAEEAKGIQPVITLKANGGARAEVAVGQLVTLTAVVELPANAGRVVAAEWSVEGAREFSPAEFSGAGAGSNRLTVRTTHAYSKPGTYFAVLRATAQRQGDGASRYARIDNLARVRVVVR